MTASSEMKARSTTLHAQGNFFGWELMHFNILGHVIPSLLPYEIKREKNRKATRAKALRDLLPYPTLG